MHRRRSIPQTPNPIWKEICPCKNSIWTLTLSNSSLVDFYHLTHDFNWNPELPFWRAGCVFSTISAGIFFWDDTDVIFAKFCFHTRASQTSSSIVFLTVSPVFRSSFPNSEYVSNFDFEISFQDWLTVFVLDKAFLEFVSRPVGSL